MQHLNKMRNKLLLLFIILFAHLHASSQIMFKIDSLSKKDKIELSNYFKGRLVNSMKSKRDKTIEINLETSDSLVINKMNYIPVALLNIKQTNCSVINFELPYLSEYIATDTLYKYVSKKRAFSNKRIEENFEYFPNNSRKLDFLPQSIEVIINGTCYQGALNRKHSIEFLNTDGRNFSMDLVRIGIEAIYVVQFRED
jgi:hypothetical protein